MHDTQGMSTPETLPTPHPAAPLAAQIESILYATGEPASVSAIAAALEISVQDVETALADLNAACASRGVRVQRQGNLVQLVTAPEFAERVQRFLGLEANNRLSSAAVETLAIIAYKQPVTKPQIEMIRGVNCDGVMKTLEMHNLIQELGRVDTVGRPMRYGVTFEFLQHFGLSGVHELPPVDNLNTLPAQESEPVQPGEAGRQPAGGRLRPAGTTRRQALPDGESAPDAAIALPQSSAATVDSMA